MVQLENQLLQVVILAISSEQQGSWEPVYYSKCPSIPPSPVLVGSVSRRWESGKGTGRSLSLLHHGGLQYHGSG